MQGGDLTTHLDSQLRIQVGERLIHQEDLRLTDNGAAHGNTLSLATGKRFRLPVKQLIQIQDLGRFHHLLLNLGLRNLAQLQRESHVVRHRHMRIQRVALENHRDIAVFRLHIVHALAIDIKVAGGNLLQPSNHTQGRGFATSGRTDKNDKLLVLNLKVEIGNRFKAIRIPFRNVLQ